jgi:hypothetical protein
MQRKSLLLGFTLGALALSGLASSTALAASCQVTNTTNPKATYSYETLQEAVNAASEGNTLKVKGTCEEDTKIPTSLTIDGIVTSAGRAMLVGNGSGSVITIESEVEVTIKGVTISGGNAATDGGGGILNEGTLTLEHSTVNDNTGVFGGGILNEGTLTLEHSTVGGNTATGSAGGILNEDTLTLEHSRVSGNNAESEAGGIETYGPLTLKEDSIVTGNTGAELGGGIVGFDGNVTLENSQVNHNGAEYGGGVWIEGAVLTLASSTVNSNKADTGGGIFMGYPSSVKLEGTSDVHANKATEEGGGIFRESSQDAIIEEPGWTGSIKGNKPDNIYTEP